MNNKENKFISLVVYMHNDESRIEKFLDTIVLFCAEHFSKYELICVDDGCIDGTVERLKAYLEKKAIGAATSVIHMSYYHGLEASMNAGRDLSIGDIVYEFDEVDVNYEAELVMTLYQRLIAGFDIVSASSRGRSHFTSKLFYALYNRTSRMKGKIGPETFRIISRRAINRVKSIGQFIPYRKAVYRNCGLKTDMITYKSIGNGKLKREKGRRLERTSLALDSFIYFTNAIERVSLILSGLFLAITLGVAFYIVFDFFSAKSKPIEGWVSTMGFMAFGFMGVFSLLTIILKYLSVMLNLIFKNQRYLIEGIEKINDNNGREIRNEH